MGEWTQIDAVETPTTPWRATTPGVTRTLSIPYTDFKLVGFMAIESGSDGITHRQVQWYPSKWLYEEIVLNSGSNTANRRIVFNFTRSEYGSRAWVNMVKDSNTKLTWRKISNTSDTYDLIVWGLK